MVAPCSPSPRKGGLLGWALHPEKSPSGSPLGFAFSPKGPPEQPEERRHRFGFEFADVLEQGQGPGLTSDYTAPPPPDDDFEEHLLVVVERGENSDIFSLTTERGDKLLVAHGSISCARFELFIAGDTQSTNFLGPAFTLQANQLRTEWLLESVRCEQCEARGRRNCGTRELAKMSHYCEAVGEGQAFCMDVDLPKIDEAGLPTVWCSVCSSANDAPAETNKTSVKHTLTTRRPRWNARHKSLTLDFRGRCTEASAKNFQLEVPRSHGRTKLLFGKVGEKKFVLDYKYPLSAVQAFAAALTTAQWK
jgi:hypothetical protein